MLPSQSPAIFTVSRLNQTVRLLLEHEMGQVWISGEISNFTQPASGHWYFTLKDDTAQVRCAMFRNSNRRVTFRPQHGQQVLVRANITLYEPRGDYQIIVESMQPAGEGLLQQKYEQLKAKLQAEGLFDQQYKKPLPSPAHCVGVITSKTGAALHDILHVLKRRDPSLPVIIYPAAVQGDDAPGQIVRAIELANQRNECDVLIVGRGGGSLEDLWSFNDERVARAIFTSRIPVVSAVGHETDVTIADFVADLRAPTPSAAAEVVSRNQQELLRQVQSTRQRLEMAMDYYLANRTRRFTQIHHRLQQQHPQLRLARQQTMLERLQKRMSFALENQLKSLRKQNRFSRASEKMFDRIIAAYGRGLAKVLNHPWLTLSVALSTLLLSVLLWVFIPKGFFPVQDNGIIQGTLQAPQSSSFANMAQRQRQVADVILQDPAVQSLTSFVGVDGTNPSLNSARLQINLKPLDERDDRVQKVIARLQTAVDKVPGVDLFLQPTQDLTIDTQVSRTQYQFTLQATSLDALSTWVPELMEKLQQLPQLSDVSSDWQDKGLVAYVNVDRDSASRLGISMADVDNALYNAFGQRLISTIYTNQYVPLMTGNHRANHDPRNQQNKEQ